MLQVTTCLPSGVNACWKAISCVWGLSLFPDAAESPTLVTTVSATPLFNCFTRVGVFTIAPCDDVPGVGELAVTDEKRRLFAEPGDGELNLSITDGPVGDNKGSDKKEKYVNN